MIDQLFEMDKSRYYGSSIYCTRIEMTATILSNLKQSDDRAVDDFLKYFQYQKGLETVGRK